MNLFKDAHYVISVWAKIYGVPLERWNNKGFFIIASALGKPLHADSMTKGRSKLGYIRVCVEINASSRFPNHIKLLQGVDKILGETKVLRMPVEYQGLSSVCLHCVMFGHLVAKCPKRLKGIGPNGPKIHLRVPRKPDEKGLKSHGEPQGNNKNNATKNLRWVRRETTPISPMNDKNEGLRIVPTPLLKEPLESN